MMDGDSMVAPAGEILEETALAADYLEELVVQKDDEIAQLQEQIKRVAAEFENFRRRQESEQQRRLDQIKGDFFREILPILDNLERAIAAGREAGGSEPLVQGVDLVLRNTLQILETQGIQPIHALGQPFDPALHEAVMVEERSDLPDETVVEEFLRGYQIGDRLLRASMVKVARHPAESEI
ncbi:MAG: nucleotide exchange factor GrpE [Candidatus Xenobium sp.]|jgi:molecular chaperone GrpE|nr:nucleotide exchange factor GrpE [Burkholderiales bacterium]